MLLQAGNQAYIQLQTEILRYVRVFKLAHRIALPISIRSVPRIEILLRGDQWPPVRYLHELCMEY
jgi:hypothetical protein